MTARIVQIGYGYWGPNLARNLFQQTDCSSLAIHDPDGSKKKAVAKSLPGVEWVEDWNEILDSARFDAAVLATPAETHYPLSREILEAGLDLLVEKPLALSTEEALELTLLAEEKDRVLMVGHTFEYNPAVERMRVLVETGELGEVFYGYSTRVNLGRVRDDIDAWWNLAPHDVAIFNFLFRDTPTKVWGQGASHLKPGVCDVVFATLEYPGNITAHIQVSWLDPSKERKLTLVGSEKMVLFDDMQSEGRLKLFDKKVIPADQPDQYGLYHTKLHSGDIHIPHLPMTEPLAAEVAHFLHCLKTRETPRSDGRCGVRVVQTLEAVSQSLSQGGGPVEVPRLPFPAEGIQDIR